MAFVNWFLISAVLASNVYSLTRSDTFEMSQTSDMSQKGTRKVSLGDEITLETVANLSLPSSSHEEELNNEDQIVKLKGQKMVLKSAFTKSKNRLEKLIDNEQPPSRHDVREAIDKVSDCQGRAIDVIVQLSELFRSLGDRHNSAKVMQEGELLEEIGTTAQNDAQSYLKSRSDASSQVSHKTDRKQSFSPSQQLQTPLSQDTRQYVEHITPALSHNNDIGKDMWKQLKRVSIPVFTGDAKAYEGWKAAFSACVDQAPATPEYKLLQLRQYVGGEALKVIQDLGHSASAYDVALERLDRKFGGMRRHIALQLEEISNFSPIRSGNAKDVGRFADMLDLVVVNMKESDRFEELGYGSLYVQLLKKMTEPMIGNFQRWIYETQRQESVETLREWVLMEAEFRTIASETVHGVCKMSRPMNRDVRKPGSFFGKQGEFDQRCRICQSNHSITSCVKFKSMPVPKRWETAKLLSLCFRCLGSNHYSKICSRKTLCGIDNCTSQHNQLLHSSMRSSANHDKGRPVKSTSSSCNEQQHLNKYQGQDSKVTMSSTQYHMTDFVSLRTVPVVLKNGTKRIVVNALLDDASTQTYINEDVSSQLGLIGEKQTVAVNVLNGRSEKFPSQCVQFCIESLDGTVDMSLSALTTTRVTGQMKVVDWQKHNKQWPHLKHIHFPKVQTPHIVDLLIGMDYLELHRSYEDVVGGEGQPVARLTPLGWTCVGNLSGEREATLSNTFFTTESKRDFELNSMLHKFWEVEELKSDGPFFTKQDEAVISLVQDTIKYENDRYEIGIPWKNLQQTLPQNYEMAYKRLCSTEKKLSKDKVVGELYEKTFTDYLEKGYIQQVENVDAYEKQWLLPHFPVVRPDRTTTKVRVVFDASAKCQGISLNDTIHQGPKLQGDLFEILLRFRRYPIALVCDIAEMYLQIGIPKADRSFFRFLWRSMDQSKVPQVYEFTRVVFGVNASPFLAQYISRENARRHEHLYPKAAETVCKSTYMDDSMDSVQDVEDGKTLYNQLTDLWGKAGMKSRKWLSNSPEVLEIIPEGDRASEVNLTKDELPSVKTLGLVWIAQDDDFCFRNANSGENIILTKRSFLREIAKLFDPLGFLSPFHIRAKVLMQQLWLCGLDWDDELTGDLKQKALAWLSDRSDLNELRFPRCLQLNLPVKETQLHVFVDASEDAYGAVLYCVHTYQNDEVTSQLVSSKSRVAPLKTVSIPRLELMAAVLGVRLLLAVDHALEIGLSSATLWTDSLNVLCWITNHSRYFKTFVANRVGFIQEHTEPSQWKHVPTELNVADILTRGTAVPNLTSDIWKYGPGFLKLDEKYWPEQSVKLESRHLSEAKSIKESRCLVTYTSSVCLLEPSRFSNWKRLVRITAWVHRFVFNISSQSDERMTGCLSAEEMLDAEKHIIITMQKEAFTDEYFALKTTKPIAKSSKLVGLNPFIDDDGLVRSSGRLEHAEFLPFKTRFPIILPRKNWVTKLIVKQHHEDGNHAVGTNQLLSTLSSRYWIIAGREEIREWERECAFCRRRKAKPASQIMAPLPKVRLRYSLRAFEQTGVDFAGPFLTIQGRGKSRTKRYLCLFTCLATRAVHLEMAHALDTDSFLNAFYRMASRRGLPTEMISDNGTNFVGAANELKQLVSQLDSDKVKSSLANRGVHWLFNPPHAPNFGGVFESMIKSAKRAIFAVLGSSDITDEELMTAFVGAEGLINSRPLTYQSANPVDDIPLTPNHFLHGQSGGIFAPDSVDNTSFNPRKRWRRVQELVRHVWRRWMKEWLPSLQSRKKWFSPSRDVQVGDVVLIISPDAPRGTWNLGIIDKTYPGSDRHVRVVDVKTERTILTRPVSKICPLELSTINMEDEDKQDSRHTTKDKEGPDSRHTTKDKEGPDSRHTTEDKEGSDSRHVMDEEKTVDTRWMKRTRQVVRGTRQKTEDKTEDRGQDR